MGSPEGIPETPKMVSIAHDDYEALVDGIQVQVVCDHIPPTLDTGHIGYVKDKETGGRLPVEILEIVRLESDPKVGTIKVKLAE